MLKVATISIIIGLVTIFVQLSAAKDGGWSPWSVHGTQCSKTCDGGVYKRYRSCSLPTPSDGALGCLKTDNVTRTKDVEEKGFECNTQHCFVGHWTNWTECVNCTISVIYRYALCGNTTNCTGDLAKTEEKSCNAWNQTICPKPCLKIKCPDYSVCKDISTEEEPKTECVCVLSRVKNDNGICERPEPTTTTKRPNPTLEPEQKTVATVVSKTASSVLIFFVSCALVLFLVLRIFTPDRVIQMNMEIALLFAHILLLFPPSITENEQMCKVVSIGIHYFFTACFCFMMLEALHMYSLVAFVVKKDGFFSRLQNVCLGWGLSMIILLFCVCFEYDNYGGEYHCWLHYFTSLWAAQCLIFAIFGIVTMTLLEAAGSANYVKLKGIDAKQLQSAKFSQRTILFIFWLVVAHIIIGSLSEYEQNLALYSIFSILNGILGGCVFFFHCTNNEMVRSKFKSCFGSLKRDST